MGSPVSVRADQIYYRFRHDDELAPGAMRVTCNHDDFTLVAEDDDFEVEISYNRPIEGAYSMLQRYR